MDIERITCTGLEHRAHAAIHASLGDGPMDYTGRHVRVASVPASRNPHPRGHGFNVLSRLARASEGVQGDRRVLVLAS